jgi:hypothetical protein
MTIEIIAILGVVSTATALVAKAYDRHQDVLYGPYIQGRKPWRPFQGLVTRMAQAIPASGHRGSERKGRMSPLTAAAQSGVER